MKAFFLIIRIVFKVVSKCFVLGLEIAISRNLDLAKYEWLDAQLF